MKRIKFILLILLFVGGTLLIQPPAQGFLSCTSDNECGSDAVCFLSLCLPKGVANECRLKGCTKEGDGIASCFDGILNQDETDTDCGGTICPKCYNFYKCGNDNDCINEVCLFSRCNTKETLEKCGDGICEYDAKKQVFETTALCPLDCTNYDRMNPFKNQTMGKEAFKEIIKNISIEKNITDNSIWARIIGFFQKKTIMKKVIETKETRKRIPIEDVPTIEWESIKYICDENFLSKAIEAAREQGQKDGLLCGEEYEEGYKKCSNEQKRYSAGIRTSQNVFNKIVERNDSGIIFMDGNKYTCNQQLFYLTYDFGYVEGWKKGFCLSEKGQAYSSCREQFSLSIDTQQDKSEPTKKQDSETTETNKVTGEEKTTTTPSITAVTKNDVAIAKEELTLSLEDVKSIVRRSAIFNKLKNDMIITLSFGENGVIKHEFDYTIKGKGVNKGINQDQDFNILLSTNYIDRLKNEDFCTVLSSAYSKKDINVERKISYFNAMLKYGGILSDLSNCIGAKIGFS